MITADLEIMRGDDEKLDMSFLTPSGDPMDVSTALALWFTAKHRVQQPDDEVVVQKVLNDGITLPTVFTGLIALDADDFADQDLATLVWDVQIKDAAGKITTLAKGTLKIVADVTRTTT